MNYSIDEKAVNPVSLKFNKTDRIDAQLIARKLKDCRLDCIRVPDVEREELRSYFVEASWQAIQAWRSAIKKYI